MKKLFVFIIFVLTIVINIFIMFYWDTDTAECNKKYSQVFNEQTSFNKNKGAGPTKKLSGEQLNRVDECISDLSEADKFNITKKLKSNSKKDFSEALTLMKRRLTQDSYKKVEKILNNDLQ